MGLSLSNQQTNDYSDYTDESDYPEDEVFISKNYPAQMDEASDNTNNICFDSATDAVSAENVTMQITINLNEVLEVEKQLDVYEKVSLLFLLEDNPVIALEELTKLLNGLSLKLLYNWAEAQTRSGQKWEEKFVEAMTTIQNYQVLKKLGFRRRELDARFMPRHMFTSVYVNVVRKSLYLVCEKLSSPEVEKLVEMVKKDFEDYLEMKYFDSLYLELYFLHWEILKYIKQDNLEKLCSILKQLGYFEMVDNLKLVPVVKRRVSIQDHNSSIKNNTSDSGSQREKKRSVDLFKVLLDDSSVLDIVNQKSSLGTDNTVCDAIDNNVYRIDPNDPGACLIINQENFYTEVDEKYKHLLPPNRNKFDSRLGTQKDKEDLVATFKMFGFKTKVEDNLKHTVILTKISEFVEKIRTESSLFICIMSHGDEGVVYGVNSCSVSVRAIQNIMCTKNRDNLLGKPKILILQSCQGTRCQQLDFTNHAECMTTDGPSSSKLEAIPPRADLFTFWATVPGYGAIRDKQKGSWFIQSLCEKMRTLSKTYHFEDICTAVINDVSSKKWCQKTEDVVAMVPLKDSTFRKKFILPPIKC